MKQRFIDFHCDTIELGKKHILRDGQGQINLQKLRQGGGWAQFFALCPPFSALNQGDDTLSPRNCYQQLLSVFQQEIAENAADIIQVTRVKELDALQGRIGAILTVEDAAVLNGELSFLDTLYADGVRLITLTWNNENELGIPHSADPARMALGLKAFGKEVVASMNKLGMVIDVSHLSDGGVRDVAAQSSTPFVASHSCARALCDHTRCLSDDLLHLMGDKGCVIGLNFNPAFVRPGSSFISAEDLVQHALHIRDKAGIAALAFGSDFDGLMPGSRLSFEDYAGMPQVAAALEKHFSCAELEMICSGNALRLLHEVWKD